MLIWYLPQYSNSGIPGIFQEQYCRKKNLILYSTFMQINTCYQFICTKIRKTGRKKERTNKKKERKKRRQKERKTKKERKEERQKERKTKKERKKERPRKKNQERKKERKDHFNYKNRNKYNYNCNFLNIKKIWIYENKFNNSTALKKNK